MDKRIFFHTYVRSFVFVAVLQDNILSTLCAGSTDGRHSHNCSSTESVVHPAGYDATRRVVLLTVSCFYRSLTSVIEERAGICELLFALCVIHTTGTDSQRCCAPAVLFALLLLLTAAAAKQRCHCHRQPKCICCLVSTKCDPTQLQPQPSP